MSRTTPLDAARSYERAQATKIAARERPGFHMTPMAGWANDPNGFCCYNGEYHLFYQYNPYSTVWGPMHWGHAVSRDLLRWTYLPAALAPDTAADAGGCFSGSAIPLPDGRLLLLYTGVQRATTSSREHQAQCVAVGDGLDFEKCENNPVIDVSMLPGGYSAVDFRDPKIWQEDGVYYCVAVGRHPTEEGSVLLFRSPNALDWEYVTALEQSHGEYGTMWECPDFFGLDGSHVLLVSPMEMQASPDGEFHAGHGTLALLGEYSGETHRFTRSGAQPIDYGLDFYAPQTMLAPDGRRIMIAWMESWDTCDGAPRRHPWFGSMTLPRELSVREGRLYQQPIRELETLWQGGVCLQGVTVDGEARFEGVRGRMLDMTLTIDAAASPRCRRFALHLAQNERLFTEIRCDLARGELVFDRSRGGSVRDIPHTRHIKAFPKDGRLKLRIVMDKGSIELFVNDGERALTACIRTPLEADGITFYSDGPVRLDIEHHELRAF